MLSTAGQPNDLLRDQLVEAMLGRGDCPHEASSLQRLIDASIREGVVALTAGRWVSQLTRQDERSELLRRVLHSAAADELGSRAAEQRVFAALQAAGQNFLVLKGAALSRWLYPATFLRPRADLDLLFADREQLARAEACLADIGYSWDGVLSNGPSFERVLVAEIGGRRHHVDAHWRMANHPVFAERFEFDELWRSRMNVDADSGASCLNPVHALIHACLHRVNNQLSGTGDRLIWLFDLHLLAERMQPSDWLRVADLASDRGLAAACLDGLNVCANCFSSPVPAHVVESLKMAAPRERFQMDNAASRLRYEIDILERLPWSQRPVHLISKLVPPPRYMRQRYALRSVLQLPWAYLSRWLSGLRYLLR